MPSRKIITPILGGHYYHIFNRGVNRQGIFFNPSNYDYFLALMDKYLSDSDCVHVLAYCLLPNHFHLVVKIKDEISYQNEDSVTSELAVGRVAVGQIRSMFIAYTMAVNIQEKRTGALFESKYKRLEIEDDDYLRYVIFYTHYNPEKHGVVDDFKNYRFSSYRAFLSNKSTKIDRDLGLTIFGGKNDFINYHGFLHDEKEALTLE